MLKQYKIILYGYDDKNEIVVWLKDEEKKLMDALVEEFEKAGEGSVCRPTMEVSENINQE